MAEIRDQLILDISKALREVDELERALNRAFADTEVTVDTSGIKTQIEALDTDLESLEATGLKASFESAEDAARRTAQATGEITDQVELTTTEYKQVVRLMEEGETATRAVATVTGQIADEAEQAEGAFRRVAQSLDISEDEARQLATSISRSTQESSELDRDLRAVATSMGLSEKEARDFAASVRRAESATAAADAETQNLSRSWQRAKGFIVAAVAAIGVRGIVNQFNEAVQASANLAESQNAVNVVFGDAARIIFPAAEEAATRYGLASRELNESATQLGATLQNAGFSAEEAANQFLELQLRASDTASVLNTDVNEILIALQSALRGEFEPIRRFAGGMNLAAVEARALSLGLISQGEALTDNARALGVTSLFMERTAKFAGDFANTSESVANQQRTLRGELENTRAVLGDALTPAFLTFLDLARDRIVDIRVMAESIREMAGSAKDAEGPFLSLGDIIGGLPRGFGALGDVVTGTVGAVVGGFTALGSVVSGPLTGDFEALDRELQNIEDSLTGMFDSLQQRAILESFVSDLREGVDPALAFANAAAATARNNELTVESLESLARISGVSEDRLQDAVRTMLDLGEGATFSADEIDVLRTKLFQLITAQEGFTRRSGGRAGVLDFDTTGINTFRQELESITDIGQTAFGSLSVFLDDAGISLADFVAAGAPIPDFLSATRTEAELTGAVFFATAEATRELADDLETRLGTAVPELGSIFEGAAEQIKESTDDIIANIQEQVTQVAEFESNLAILAARGQAALAAALLEEGPKAASAAAAFVDNIEDAIEAEDLITGTTATAKADEARAVLATALAAIDLSPEGRLALLSFAEGLTDPGALAAISKATAGIVDTTVGGIRGGLQIRSPSKVMMQLGELAAEGFFLGLESGIRAPAIPNFGDVAAPVAAGAGGGNNIEINFNTTPNPTTDTVRIAQTTRSLMR